MGKRQAPSERILQAVREHPETRTVNIGGADRLFLLNGYGAKLARERGHDPVPAIVSAVARIAPALQQSGMFTEGKEVTGFEMLALASKLITGEVLDDIQCVIFWGLLSADPDLDYDELGVLLTPTSVRGIVSEVWPAMLSYMRDRDEADEETTGGGSGEASGN